MKIDGRTILRRHAIALIVLTTLLTFATYVGAFTGYGPYGALKENTLANTGLVQAYTLMGLVAVSMWIGSRGSALWRFSVLGIVAHCIPLSALVAFWAPLNTSPIAAALPLSFVIHGSGIFAETMSLRFGYERE